MAIIVSTRSKNELTVNFRELILTVLCVAGAMASAALLTGCATAVVDRGAVTATEGAPASTEIPVVSIPHDASRPTFVVAVEPFIFAPTVAPDENVYHVTYRRSGETLAAKLTTTLANIGNVSVLDQGLKKKKDGSYSAKLQKGEVGPFVIRATITEYTENAEATSNKRGVSLGWVGAVAGIAGAIAGKPGLLWSGAGVAAANPTIKANDSQRKGMVAIDFRVVDGRTSRIVGAFKSTGTFQSASSERTYGLLGISNETKDFAQSVLGQAIQAALNDAAQQIHSKLASRG